MGSILLSTVSLAGYFETFFSQVKSLFAKGIMMGIMRVGIEKL